MADIAAGPEPILVAHAARSAEAVTAFKKLVDDYEAAGGDVLLTLFSKDTALHKAFLAWAKKAWPHWFSETDADYLPSLRAWTLEKLIYDEEDEAATVCVFFDQLPAATKAPVLAAIAAQAEVMFPTRKGKAAAKAAAPKAAAKAKPATKPAPATKIKIGKKTYKSTATELELEDHQLTALPDEIGDMTALVTLDLAGNPITTLPAALSRCANLRKLFIGSTALTALPRLPQVEVLSAPRTSAALLASLAAVPNLTDLCIADCGLTELPASLRALKKLGYLDFQENPITTLPPWIAELSVSNFAWPASFPAALSARLTKLEGKNRGGANRKRSGA